MKINIQYNVGKAKYVVNYSDGTKRHKDGSEFFDIAIFKNKKEMEDFITSIQTKREQVQYCVASRLTYEEILNWFGFAFESGLFEIDPSDPDGMYGFGEAHRIIRNNTK